MDYIREAIEYLKSYKDLQASLENLSFEIKELNAVIPGDKSIELDGMPHGSGSSLPDDAIVNKLFRLQKAKEEYVKTKKAIDHMDKVLAGLSDSEEHKIHEKVLRLWFLENRRADDIGKQINCSERHVFRIKNIAIRRLAVQLFGIKVIGS